MCVNVNVLFIKVLRGRVAYVINQKSHDLILTIYFAACLIIALYYVIQNPPYPIYVGIQVLGTVDSVYY